MTSPGCAPTAVATMLFWRLSALSRPLRRGTMSLAVVPLLRGRLSPAERILHQSTETQLEPGAAGGGALWRKLPPWHHRAVGAVTAVVCRRRCASNLPRLPLHPVLQAALNSTRRRFSRPLRRGTMSLAVVPS